MNKAGVNERHWVVYEVVPPEVVTARLHELPKNDGGNSSGTKALICVGLR